jgi:hypothetical protein
MSDFQGKAREMAGRVQEKVGEFTGDAKTQPYLSQRRSVICWGGSPGNLD